MRSSFFCLEAIAVVLLNSFVSHAQGTVAFANSGNGVTAPVTINGRAVEAEDRVGVGLFISEIESVGLASIKEGGVFDGGEVVVPNALPGTLVEIVLKIFHSGELVYESKPFSVVLGESGRPALLDALNPINIEVAPPPLGVEWAVFGFEFGAIGPLECVATDLLAFVAVDLKECKNIPVPDQFRTLHFERTRDGLLEIMWPQNLDLVLFGSPDLVEPEWQPIPTKGVNGRGAFFVQIDPSDGVGIFRLGEAPTNQE